MAPQTPEDLSSSRRRVQFMRRLGTFFDGLVPRDEAINFIYHEESAVIPLPLVFGTTTQIFAVNTPNPPNQVLLLYHVEFYITTLVGGQWVVTADDFAQNSIYFEVLFDGRAPWSVTGGYAGAANVINGFDLLNTNVMSRFSTRPTALVSSENVVLGAQFTIENAALPVPANSQAGVRLGGIYIPLDAYRKWAE